MAAPTIAENKTGSKLLPTSTVGAKFIVAITGAALTLFVLFHMAGNLQVFLGREVLNRYAQFLKDNPEIIWPARIGLLAFFLIHIVLTVRLKLKNQAARPVGYVYRRQHQEATFASRTMILSGLVILAFVIYHLLHLTFGVTHPDHANRHETLNTTTMMWEHGRADAHNETRPQRHDLYSMVVLGFRQPLVALSYIVAQLFLGLHLWHAVASIFQSLGINRPRWENGIKWLGKTVALIVVAGNVAMPLAILLDHYAGIGWFSV